MAQSAYSAPALEKGLDVLELLVGKPDGLSMSQIAKELDRSRNEIYRMVLVLEQRGYVARMEDPELFRLTNKLFGLTLKHPRIADLHSTALPYLHELSETLLQSAQLAVLSGPDIVVVAKVESPADVGFSVRLGHRRSVLKSASGTVFHAFSNEMHRQRLLNQIDTEQEADEYQKLLKRSKTALKNGYVKHPSRIVKGVTDVAAPIFGQDTSQPLASLAIPYVESLRSPITLDKALPLVVETAKKISVQLLGD